METAIFPLFVLLSIFHVCNGQFLFPWLMEDDISGELNEELPSGFQFIGGLHVPQRRTLPRITNSFPRRQTQSSLIRNILPLIRQLVRRRLNFRNDNGFDNTFNFGRQRFMQRGRNQRPPQVPTIPRQIPNPVFIGARLQQPLFPPAFNQIFRDRTRFQRRPRFPPRNVNPWFLRGR